MRFLLTAILVLFSFQSLFYAEEKPEDKKKPKKELKLLFSTTQSSFSNWQIGGSNSLAFSCSFEGSFRKISDRWDREYDIELGMGVIKQEGTKLRKSEDLIHYSYATGYSFKKDGKWALFLDLDFRSQFASGYNYEKNPFEEDMEIPVKVSDFFSPAYLTQSISISFRKEKWFRSSLGIGLKQIFVSRPGLRELYGLPEEKAVQFETGISSKLKLEKEIVKNIKINSVFDLFFSVSPKNNLNCRWNNKFDVKFNSWLQMRVEVEMFYDKNIIDILQIREVMSLGLIFNILKPT